MRLSQVAAISEVLMVLVAGNLFGALLFSIMFPAPGPDQAISSILSAFSEGLSILLRLGSAGALGFALLYGRRRLTPRQAGLSRASHTLGFLIKEGLLYGWISSFLICLLFAAQKWFSFGTGLPAWQNAAGQPLDFAFLISLAGTSVLVPPLTEEILTRGYIRTRMVESFGPMAGVILTAAVFGLSHARYISTDPMLSGFLLVLLVNSFIWTYSAQQTGSIIPAIIAHALSNAIGTAVLFNVWWPLVLLLPGIFLFRTEAVVRYRQFIQTWKSDAQRGSVWSGLVIVSLFAVTVIISFRLAGRMFTLYVLGAFTLLITLLHVVSHRKDS